MPELVCAADDPRWLDERRHGITATDIVAITGLSPYESQYSLYYKKLGVIPDEHQDSDRLRLGRELEPIIVARWREACLPPEGLARDSHRPRLYRSSTRPWQMATPDAQVWNNPDDDLDSPPDAVLEVKSWADAGRDRWGPGMAYDTDGTPLVYDDQIPPHVRAQVLWQMDTLDVATGHVGVLFLPSGEFRSYTIGHRGHGMAVAGGMILESPCLECDDIALLRDAGRDFMDRLDRNDPPSPDASSATLAALKARFADPHHDKTAEIDADLYGSWVAAKVTSEHFAEQARGHEVLIREQAGEARILTVGGIPVARHIISVVKAHMRKESRRDSIIRIKNGETSE